MYELKKSKKYSTNIRHRRKRRSYIRKNSMKNKILYGGSVYTLTFESKGLTVRNLKTCTFLKIQLVYKLLVLKQKEENIIQYFIFTSNKKSASLQVFIC
jgi:hypothetical protein